MALTLPAGVSASGSLSLAVNTTSSAVNRTVTVGGTPLALSLPAGPYLRFEATGLTLSVLGQTLSGNFAFERVADETGGTLVRIAGTDVALSLGGVLRVSNGTALVLLTPGGLAGRIGGTVAFDLPGCLAGRRPDRRAEHHRGRGLRDLHPRRGADPAGARGRSVRAGRRHRPGADRARARRSPAT